jgi:hypothetical protein
MFCIGNGAEGRAPSRPSITTNGRHGGRSLRLLLGRRAGRPTAQLALISGERIQIRTAIDDVDAFGAFEGVNRCSDLTFQRPATNALSSGANPS